MLAIAKIIIPSENGVQPTNAGSRTFREKGVQHRVPNVLGEKVVQHVVPNDILDV